MNKINVISCTQQSSIGTITIDHPPVNALSQAVRSGLIQAIDEFEQNESIKVIIIRCASKTFIAGADIKEFGKAPTEPFLPQVLNRIEACRKPVVASMFGTSLGGGFELALACHYRVTLSSAKVGLPEVNLGLIPGAGGTQRLPRILDLATSVEMITSGKPTSVNMLKDTDLFDAIYEDKLDQNSLIFAQSLIENNQLSVKPVSKRERLTIDLNWDETKSQLLKKARGQNAPLVALDVLKKTSTMNFEDGINYEREKFLELRESEQAAALRHAFQAEKQSAKLSSQETPLEITKVGVIGGGNMGSGIATSFLMANFKVILAEQNQLALDSGLDKIKVNIMGAVKRKRITAETAEHYLANLSGETDYQAFTGCQLVIEAVYEDLELKKSVFKELSDICSDSTILASNTSYLDLNQIAASVKRPQQVVGLHFFSPAHIMKLLEVVKAEHTSNQVLATAMKLGKQLKKIPVQVGVCFGFAANRTYTRYGREIQQMLLEGASVEQIDKAMTNWGMAMGPLAVQDLSGIDIGHSARSARPFPTQDPGYFRAAATMVEHNRLGRKTQAGFYHYDETNKSSVDDKVTQLLRSTAKKLGITQHEFTEKEIVHRALFALISEGLQLLKAGIVERLSDLDVIWLHGYGFPRFKGGPMFQAQQLGIKQVSKELAILREQFGEHIWPEVDLSFLQN